ncbi:MAG TPA: M20 family metallopeptidase [Kiritimatiellia bacterium]
MKPVVQLLQELVSIPSVNPALTDDPAIGGEARMAEFLSGYLEDRKFKVEWYEATRGRPNVVGRFGPDQPRHTILLESHLDTQGIHQMTVPPFDGGVRDGRLYGRGACDTKGPMAAALTAMDAQTLDRLAAAGVQVIYVGAMGEEKGNIGAEELVEGGLGADEAIVFEPTDLNIVHAHKGALWFEVEVEGLAAHGSNPKLGVNAIRGMTRAVEVIDKLTDADAASRSHPLLGTATVNIGVIRGGASINIVPDRCVMQVDRRTLPGDDHEAILRDIGKGLDALKSGGIVRDWHVRKITEGVPFATPADSALVRGMLAACSACGVQAKAEGAAWYSDAGPFSRTCKEVAVFGPGSIRQAHTVDEFIELESLEKGREILSTYLNKLAAS